MLSASIDEPSYSRNEIDLNLAVCVLLEGLIERDVAINLFTNDDSATGK